MRRSPLDEQTGAFLALGLRHGLNDGAPQFERFRLAAVRGELQPHQGERQVSRQSVGLKVHDSQEGLRGRLTLVGRPLSRETPRPV